MKQSLMKNITENFFKFGISKTESRIYLFLTKNNPKTAYKISESLKIPKTTTYNLLMHLQNKGIVIACSGKSIKFVAAPSEKAIQILTDEKKSRINKLEKEIPHMTTQWDMIPYGESYKGFPT